MLRFSNPSSKSSGFDCSWFLFQPVKARNTYNPHDQKTKLSSAAGLQFVTSRLLPGIYPFLFFVKARPTLGSVTNRKICITPGENKERFNLVLIRNGPYIYVHIGKGREQRKTGPCIYIRRGNGREQRKSGLMDY